MTHIVIDRVVDTQPPAAVGPLRQPEERPW